MRRTLGRSALLAALATLGLVVPAEAAVFRQTTPVSEVITNPCTGEDVQLSGSESLLFQVAEPASGGLTVFVQIRTALTGVGLTTGTRYINDTVIAAPGQLGFVEGGNAPFEFNQTFNEVFISQGGQDNFARRVLLHQTLLPDGTLTTFFLRETPACRG